MAHPTLPPGPPSVPILGSLPFVDKNNLRGELVRLSKEHNSDIISIKLGPRLAVFLNSYDIIEEAFSGDFFPDRPDILFFLANEKQGLGSSSGALWEAHRPISVSLLRDLAEGKMSAEENVIEEAQQLCKELENRSGKPVDLTDILNLASTNVISATSVGRRYEYEDPGFFQHVLRLKKTLIAYGSSLLGMFPCLRHIPGNLFGFGTIRHERDSMYKVLEEHIREHKEHIDPEKITDFLDGYLVEKRRQDETNPDNTFTDEQIKNVVSDLFVAGCDHGGITLLWGVLMMMANPDVQKKAQIEIDQVVGKDRFPTMLDKEKLPFTEATVLETHRWGTLASFGLPHCNLNRDVTFRNFSIPKGTTVAANLWGVHRDPDVWKFPDVFNPLNFLDAEGKVVEKKELIPFALGRRQCPGMRLAKMTAFLTFASLLQRFTFSLPEGAELPELEAYNVPHPYKVCITPRT